MIPGFKRARPIELVNEPWEDAVPLAELEAALQHRIGWADELVSPFARNASDEELPATKH